ncbi:MAG: hypothetical protein C4327_00360 [Meiothermus sp.]
MKRALWLILAALPLAFAAAPSKAPMSGKPAMHQVVTKVHHKRAKHHTARHKVLRHAKHSTHKAAKPVKKP